MKIFFKSVFASFIGFILGAIVLFLILIAAIEGIIYAAENEQTSIVSNSILHITLQHPISDRSPQNPFRNIDLLNLNTKPIIGLNDVIKCIQNAASDKNIKAIYLDISNLQTGWASVEEIRNALIVFKKSKKKIIAYSEIYTQKAYYLASVADKIYLNPQGYLEFKGLNTEYVFLKGALEKLGIEPQIIRVGTYKSAVEPFINDKMSDASRKQTSELLNNLYQHFIKQISLFRGINQDTLLNIANELRVRNAIDAVKTRLIDQLKYKDEVLNELQSICGAESIQDLSQIPLDEYTKAEINSNQEYSKNRIAIIYATGDIVGGEGSEDDIGSEAFSKIIRNIRLDNKIKAVVLRINSPGGSALASDIIWREIALTQKIKPVIVSMGDVAASGGYYIACAAQKIVAEPNTITGSIGIFGIIPNLKNFFNNKLGITFDGVKTSKFADLGAVYRPLTEDEKLILQKEIERGYQTFISKVALGRKKQLAEIDQIAQGRVWSGIEAKKNGLIDTIGGLNTAVAIAKKEAKLTEYQLVEYPKQKNFLSTIMADISDKTQNQLLNKELGEHATYYRELKKLSKLYGSQARLLYSLDIH